MQLDGFKILQPFAMHYLATAAYESTSHTQDRVAEVFIHVTCFGSIAISATEFCKQIKWFLLNF